MKTTIEIGQLTNMRHVAAAAAITQRLDTVRIPSVNTWLRWLRAEHSMIRALKLRIKIVDLPYYVHVHLRTHGTFNDWYVGSQRETSLNPVDYDRRKAPQDAPISLMVDTNPQCLIDMSRRRLCSAADEVTRALWLSVKREITLCASAYIHTIGSVMLPDCLYRGGVCHELKPCGYRPHYEDGVV